MRKLCTFVLSGMLLAACAARTPLVVTRSPTGIPPSTASSIPPTSYHTPSPAQVVDALINIIEASDPASGRYDPNSLAYADFPQAVSELAKLNSETNSAANELAYAIGFPRPDASFAATALISLGPTWARPNLTTLLDHLNSPRPSARLYSLIIISTVGPDGSCALGQVGPLLWDSDPHVRTAAALAAQSLSGRSLVSAQYAIDPSALSPTPVVPDTPEGQMVDNARSWWTTDGSKVNWHPVYGMCDP